MTRPRFKETIREWLESPSIDVGLIAVVGILTVMYVSLSVKRYTAYNAGMFDLGNMAQSIWSATRGLPLQFTNYGVQHTRLAFHVEVFYFLIAPLYALFDSPITLLVFQSVLFSLGSLPIYRLTRRNFSNPWIPRLMVIGYLFYPVAQTAVLFDFHGDTLAAPFLLFAIDAWDRGALRPYARWLILALSCKFYVGAAVAALGVVIMVKGDRRTGFWTFIAGVGWGSFAFLVIKPWAAEHLASASAMAATSEHYLSVYFGYVRQILHPYHLVPRLATLLLVIAPALWLGHRAPVWWLPAAATILPALISSRGSYDYRFHHYALSVPFLIVAAIYGAKKISESGVMRETLMHVVITLLLSALLVDTPLNPMFWTSVPGWGLDSWAYGRTSRDTFKDQWLAEHVPEKVSLGSSFFISPHVINRSRIVTLTNPETEAGINSLESALETTDWIVADALFDYLIPSEDSHETQRGIPILERSLFGIGHPGPADGGVLYDKQAIRILLEHKHYDLISAQDGLLLFSRKGLAEGAPLSYRLTTSSIHNDQEPLIKWGDHISLLDFDLEQMDGSRYLLTYTWMALQAMEKQPQYIAVTELEGIPHPRFVHLPTFALYPTTSWKSGEVVREQFEIHIPEGIQRGRYQLQVGWFDSSHMYAAWTDTRSQIGRSAPVAEISLDY